jgi:hypothetical protein
MAVAAGPGDQRDGNDGPEEAGELAGDGDVDDGRALAALGEVVMVAVQASLDQQARSDCGRPSDWRRGRWR